MIVGYARVSTDGQTLDAQHTTLRAAGAEQIFAEKVSGVKTNRRQLQLAIEALGVGDVLVVTSVRSAGEKHKRLAQCPCDDFRERRGVQIAGRYLGRYDYRSRSVDVECARWAR